MKKSTLYSIGHGAKSLEQFVEELKSFSIKFLLDVRTTPASKWHPHFNQNNLKWKLKEQGITYDYVGDKLGGMPEDRDCYTEDGKVDYRKVAQKEFFKQGLERLLKANEGRYRVAIMCSEADPAMCHRTKLIGEELYKREISLNHIIGPTQERSQDDVYREITGHQRENLFPDFEEQFTSRGVHIKE